MNAWTQSRSRQFYIDYITTSAYFVTMRTIAVLVLLAACMALAVNAMENEMEAYEAPASTSAPAPVTNSTLSRWSQKLAAHCTSYSTCDTCGSDGRCAWCSSGSGACLPLDVNANLRGSGISGDGLTSGQC